MYSIVCNSGETSVTLGTLSRIAGGPHFNPSVSMTHTPTTEHSAGQSSGESNLTRVLGLFANSRSPLINVGSWLCNIFSSQKNKHDLH